MRGFFNVVAIWLVHLGGPGLVLVGIADSSFLVAPLANDLLVVTLTARHPGRMFLYAVLAASGSMVGCLILDVASRRAKQGVEEKVSGKGAERKVRFVESRIRRHAGWTLAIAAVIPPPFPFTPFVAVAAGTGYPRKKLLSIVLGARFVRFAAEGGLAILFGRRILSWAKAPAVEYMVVALIVIAICGSGYSIFRWTVKSRGSGRRRQK